MAKSQTTARGPSGDRTDIWRTFSWYLGDEHADRLCRILDFYCRLVGRKPSVFWLSPPN